MRVICFLKFGNSEKSETGFYSVTSLRKNLICLLSILNISQPKHGFRFIFVTLYNNGRNDCAESFFFWPVNTCIAVLLHKHSYNEPTQSLLLECRHQVNWRRHYAYIYN
jgi:hypothetical protein